MLPIPTKGSLRRLVPLLWLCLACFGLQSLRAEESRFWNIPEGPASDTLNRFAREGNLQLMYSDAAVSGVQTRAVKGWFVSERVLELMLRDTPLAIVQTDQKRIFAIKLSESNVRLKDLAAQQESSESEDPVLPPARNLFEWIRQVLGENVERSHRDPWQEEPFELSPFLVDSSAQDQGYFAEYTLAGSRLNSKVSDLAASITVITRQQMSDTASVDLNDVFLYEANTEGMFNYSAYSIDKDGAVQDIAAGFSNGPTASGPFSANRIRGIDRAETARNYFPSIDRIPFDSYNAATFEINRGPNSILFGLGNAAGIVNQSLSTPLMGVNSTSFQQRWGSWGAQRTSWNLNRTLWQDVLALQIAGVRDEKGFQRKPSHDRTTRSYASLNFQPGNGTHVIGFYEVYRNQNRRPNSFTPRDLITPWKQAGSPSWHPVDRTVTWRGEVSGPYDSDDALPGVLWSESNRPLLSYERGVFQSFTQRRLSHEPDEVDGTSIYRTLVSGYIQPGPLWVATGVTDRDLYDWEHLNLLSGNTGEDEATLWGVEFDQEILAGLYVNFGWFRESFSSDNSYYLAQQTGATLQVDPNSHRLDGSTNPFFGKAFIEIREPDDFHQWETNHNFRAAVAYAMDFGEISSKWAKLGRLNFMLLWSQRDVEQGTYRFRQMVNSNNRWVNRSDLSTGPGGAVHRRFYLGDSGGNVSLGPGLVRNGEQSFWLERAIPVPGTSNHSKIENWSWTRERVQMTNALHSVSGIEQRQIRSKSWVYQHYAWDDRLVATFGWRRDEHHARSTLPPSVNPETGLPDINEIGEQWFPFQKVSSDTRSAGVVAKVWKGLSVHVNESENFQPAGVRFNILDGSTVPLPTGHGRDFGVSFDLGAGRFYARVNGFEIEQKNTRISSQLWRMGYFDFEAFQDWANLVAQVEGLVGVEAEARVAGILKFPEGFQSYWNRTSSTSDIVASGLELNLIYNPTRNWTIKFNLAQQRTRYSNVFPEYEAWKQARLEVWKAAYSPALPEGYQYFWTYPNLTARDPIRHIGVIGGEATATPESWFYTNVDSLVTLSKGLEDKVTSGQREWRWNLLSDYRFSSGVMRNWSFGGGIRWEDKSVIGYMAGAAGTDGVVRELDANQPVFDEAQWHVDLWCTYRNRIWNDRIQLTVQFNVRDAFEAGGLRPVGVNPDGVFHTYRIVDPRQFFLTVGLEF